MTGLVRGYSLQCAGPSLIYTLGPRVPDHEYCVHTISVILAVSQMSLFFHPLGRLNSNSGLRNLGPPFGKTTLLESTCSQEIDTHGESGTTRVLLWGTILHRLAMPSNFGSEKSEGCWTSHTTTKFDCLALLADLCVRGAVFRSRPVDAKVLYRLSMVNPDPGDSFSTSISNIIPCSFITLGFFTSTAEK